MAKNLKQIKLKIRAIGHLQKITEAMEKVAAVKMRKINGLAAKSRHYAFHAMKILADLKGRTDSLLHPFLEDEKMRNGNKIGLIVLTSNKGLCGSFNSKVFNLTEASIYKYNKEGFETEIICVGKKGNDYFRKKLKSNTNISFVDTKEEISERDVLNVAALSINNYLKNNYVKIAIIFNDFISTAVQKPTIEEILPIRPEYIKEMLIAHGYKSDFSSFRYSFEPSTEIVLHKVLEDLVKIQIFQALLDSKNSEYAQRYAVMKNATEKSGEIIENLGLEFNKTRQAAITQEIAEVTSGTFN